MSTFSSHRFIFPALFISYAPLLVFVFAALGVQGNTYVTGAALSLGLASSAAALWSPNSPQWNLADTLFAIFVCGAIASFAITPFQSDAKGMVMLAIAVLCYPAGRFFRLADTERLRQEILNVSTVVVAIGVVLTTWSILNNLDNASRSVVLNFEHAATVFAASLGIQAIAFAHSDQPLTSKFSILQLALIMLAAVVFSAAMVRFMFVAMLLALIASMAFPNSKRKLICAALLLIGISIGQFTRYDVATRFFQQTISAASLETASSCLDGPDMRNSIEIRKSLALDAFRMLPSAGLFGHGLDSFDSFTCLKGFGPHNAALQALLEFGWLSGIAFVALLMSICIRLIEVARRDSRVSFLLTLVGFEIAISLVHGRLNQDFQLFLFMGLAATAIAQTSISRIASH